MRQCFFGDTNPCHLYSAFSHKVLQGSSCIEVLPGGRSHVTRLNFKTSRVGVYKCLSLLLSALPSLSQFGRGRLSLVTISFLALSLLFGPCRLSEFTLAGPLYKLGRLVGIVASSTVVSSVNNCKANFSCI